MAKDKKKPSNKTLDKKSKKSKKNKPSSDGLNGLLAQLQTVGDLRRQVGQLSTGQVVVGGVALLAAGLTYWAKQQASGTSSVPVAPTSSSDATPELATREQESPVDPETAVTPTKKAKARKREA